MRVQAQLILILTSVLITHAQVVAFTCETPAIADIVFLVDGSLSISPDDFNYMRNYLEMFVRAFTVGSNQTRIGLVQYSDDPRLEWHLNTYSTKEAVIDAIRNLSHKRGLTLTGLALTYILENSFKAESGSRPDVPKIGILITNGKSQDNVFSPAQRLRDAGIELFAIGVRNTNENELSAIASPPEETHVYNTADFSVMSCIVERLTRSVCEHVSELSVPSYLPWGSSVTWWLSALPAPPWWSSAAPWWPLAPPAPPWWSMLLWWSSAPSWGSSIPSALLWWSSALLWGSSVPSAPPWWSPALSALPWWSPDPSALPWRS